jgi:hypothetical protein
MIIRTIMVRFTSIESKRFRAIVIQLQRLPSKTVGTRIPSIAALIYFPLATSFLSTIKFPRCHCRHVEYNRYSQFHSFCINMLSWSIQKSVHAPLHKLFLKKGTNFNE